MTRGFRLIAFLLVIACALAAQSSFEARTEDGTLVRLFIDGTWEYVKRAEPKSAAGGVAAERVEVEAAAGPYSVWIDPDEWTAVDLAAGGDTKIFQHSSGQVYATFAGEDTPVSLGTAEAAALINIRQADPDAKVVATETVMVNGLEARAIETNATITGTDFRYRGIYFGGQNGNFALVGYTVRSKFEENRAIIDEFLAGLVIDDEPYEEPLPADGDVEKVKVEAVHGPYEVWIDPNRWSEVESTSPNGKMFQSKSGLLYGMFVGEDVPVSLDTAESAATFNAKRTDPDAKVVKTEKIMLEGKEVRVVEFEATTSGTKFRFRGYYFGGRAGNVALAAFTVQSDFEAQRAEIDSFLSGLVINDEPYFSEEETP